MVLNHMTSVLRIDIITWFFIKRHHNVTKIDVTMTMVKHVINTILHGYLSNDIIMTSQRMMTSSPGSGEVSDHDPLV